MDGGHFQFLAQLCLDCRHLIPVRRNDANTPIPMALQTGKDLLPNHINLSLIQVATGVVARSCPVHGQHIRLFMVLCHDDELPTIEFLIAKIDDHGMTAIVFPQKNGRSLRPCGNGRGEQTVGGEMVGLGERIPSPDFLAFLNVLVIQHIGELLKVSHNNDVVGTGKGQNSGGQSTWETPFTLSHIGYQYAKTVSSL